MISPQFIHSLFFISVLFFTFAEGLAMPLRLLAISTLFTALYTVSSQLPLQNTLVFNKSSRSTHWVYALAAGCFLFCGLFVHLSSPPQGLKLEWLNNEHLEKFDLLHYERFEMLPSRIPQEVQVQIPERLTLSGYFQLKTHINAWLLFTSHGKAIWKLDGETIAEIHPESNIRSLFSYTDIPPGVHHLSCEISGYTVVPVISARMSTGINKEMSVLSGPFVSSLDKGGLHLLYWKNHAFWLFMVLGLMALVPVMNNISYVAINYLSHYSGILMTGLWVITVCAILTLQSSFMYHPEFLQIEADEAAFGLMSQQLLYGQSPPLFHYGQNYQGTSESIVLAFLQMVFSSPETALKALPTLWFILFVGITAFTLWRFGSASLSLFSCVVFLFMGIHFHWLFHKAWFGYSFSLVCGAVMWFAALNTLQYGLRPGIAALWGIFAGISLYELPVSISFVMTTFVLMLYSSYQAVPLDRNTWKMRMYTVMFHKSMLILYACLVVCLSPYILYIALEGKTDSLSFLVKGRELSAPKESGEHPFINRFLEECLPVLSGNRLPYDQQAFPDEILFPYLPSVLLVISMLSFLVFCRRWNTKPLSNLWTISTFQNTIHLGEGFLFFHPVAYFGVFFFAVFVIGLGCYSPFGIWPWYFASIYWALPVLLYPLFITGIKNTPGLTIIISALFIYTQTQSFSLLNQRAFQPLSISAAGLELPSNFTEIADSLREHDVHFVIADQGYDYSSGDAGRDWIGETASFQTGMQVISFDSHSRRLPDQAQLLMRANRVSYLFHQDFLYQNPVPGDTNYSSITMKKLETLFGSDFLNYQRLTFPPYILFIPPKKMNNELPILSKNQLFVEAGWPYFVEPILDHNLGIRSTSSRAYWSSGSIPPEGVTLSFSFDKARRLNRLVLFHGIKANDYPLNNEVKGYTSDGKEISLGKLNYFPEALASKLDIADLNEFHSVKILVFPNDEYWLTVYEAWIW